MQSLLLRAGNILHFYTLYARIEFANIPVPHSNSHTITISDMKVVLASFQEMSLITCFYSPINRVDFIIPIDLV